MTLRLSILVLAIACVVACDRKGDKPVVAASPPTPTFKVESNVPPPFCLVALKLQSDVRGIGNIEDRQLRASLLTTLAALRPPVAIAAAVRGAKEGAGKSSADCAESSPSPAKIGVLATLSAGIFNAQAKVVPIDKATVADELVLSVAMHVERGGSDGRPEIGVSELTAGVPFRKRAAAEFVDFVDVRLQRAAATAAADALGQLLARGFSDKQLLAQLKAPEVWRQVGAIREVGERGLTEGLDDVEAAAKSSRKDLSVVAISTLGRLGKDRSLAPLKLAVDSRSVEVVDAALTAISDIGGEQAVSLIQSVADQHRSRWIRRRAKLLLPVPSSGK